MNFSVSVIIPVYNAAPFLEEACKSALDQEEVVEVILVEDGSTDKSLSLCEKLKSEYPRVILMQHDGNSNQGPSASRNLGIRHAVSDFVSFLDADDYYLPGRFKNTKQTFVDYPEADAVYECALHVPKMKNYNVSKIIPPQSLLNLLLRGKYGHFHTNAITIKRKAFEKTGFFNEELYLHQDSEMWLRMAYACVLVPGKIAHPVAVIRTHDNNRISKYTHVSQLKAYRAFRVWLKGKKQIGFVNKILLFRKIAKLLAKEKERHWFYFFIKEVFYS